MRDKPYYLPGDKSNRHDISRLLRVDHAGEYGAVRIYSGQIKAADKVSDNSDNKSSLRHMLEQEQNHLEHFNELLNKHKVRPSLLSPLWHGGGWVLGYMTARLGDETAFACTESVETVIDKHYSEQIDDLATSEHKELLELLEKFRLEELEHRDEAIERGAKGAIGYSFLTRFIGNLSRVSIAIAKDI